MANHQSVLTCNGFKVKDPDSFQEVLENNGISSDTGFQADPVYSREKDNMFHIYGYDTATTTFWYYPDGSEDEIEVDIIKLVQPHLAEGSVAIFKYVGFTKCRFDECVAAAVIVTSDQIKNICFDTDVWNIARQMQCVGSILKKI